MSDQLPVSQQTRSPRFSDLPLWKRLPILLRSGAARLFQTRYLVVQRLGAYWLIDQKNMVDHHILTRGDWEAEQINTLRHLIEELRPKQLPAVFLDIGSHGGLYAIQMAQLSIFNRIISIEADRRNAYQQRANLFLNNLEKRIELLDAAAFSEIGEVTLRSGPEGNRGRSALGAGSADGEQVKAITIDSLSIPSNTFVVAKIDVEGAELEVLAGMKELLRSNTGLLQIETRGANFEKVRSYMEELGFHWQCSVDDDHYFGAVA